MSYDSRNIRNGDPIPSENYVDQPYVVVTKDGNWLCVLTTGPGQESQENQHVVATISQDKGKTWSPLIDIEKSSEPINSWVTAVVVPSGRVYAIYCYNHDGISSMHGGLMAFRYSDDHGRTWSERHSIPMRLTKKDRENITGGKTQFWWCIDKPVLYNGSVYFGIPKIHNGWRLDDDEGWLIRGDNFENAKAPSEITWHTLPDGDEGIFNPELGLIHEEQNVEVLSDGTLYMVNRTVSGHPEFATSKDNGHTWSKSQKMHYADGRPMKTPRACPRMWKAPNGKFLFWFHNNSYPGWGNTNNRNPVWASAGIEQDGDILWGEPEILLYDPDPTMMGMSYPDFIFQDGCYWASETQKMVARAHAIDVSLLEGAWNQFTAKERVNDSILVEAGPLQAGASFELPRLPSLDGGGFTLEMWIEFSSLWEDHPVLSTLGKRRKGFNITIAPNNTLKFEMTDGQVRRWFDIQDGPNPAATLKSTRTWNWTMDDWALECGKVHHLVWIVDGASKVSSFLVDGKLLDGGTTRSQGWQWLNHYYEDINDDGIAKVGDRFPGKIHALRVYGRYLRTSEAIANYHAGLPK